MRQTTLALMEDVVLWIYYIPFDVGDIFLLDWQYNHNSVDHLTFEVYRRSTTYPKISITKAVSKVWMSIWTVFASSQLNPQFNQLQKIWELCWGGQENQDLLLVADLVRRSILAEIKPAKESLKRVETKSPPTLFVDTKSFGGRRRRDGDGVRTFHSQLQLLIL